MPFLSNSNTPLQTPTALEDDILTEVYMNIIAPTKCLLVGKRSNQIGKTTAVKDDLLIEVFLHITAPIRCLFICERGNQVGKSK